MLPFVFVDGRSKSYRSPRIRSKVMRHAVKEKNRRLGIATPEVKPRYTRIFELENEIWVAKGVKQDNEEENRTANASARQVAIEGIKILLAVTNGAKDDVPTPVAPPKPRAARKVRMNEDIPTHSSFQPRTILGAGRVDHFSALPVARTPVIDEFVASYLGPLDATISTKRKFGFDYRLARFQDAITDPCSFYAMLTWLHRRAVLRGDLTGAMQSLHFKGECLRMMGERLKDYDTKGVPITEGTLFGALDLSNSEARFGDTNLAMIHWNGLRRMIITKGGLTNITSQIPLIYSLIWNYLALGLNQGIQWTPIPITVNCNNDAIRDHKHQLHESSSFPSPSAFQTFLDALSNPSTLAYLAHPTILTSLSPGHILHFVLCTAKTCSLGRKTQRNKLYQMTDIQVTGAAGHLRSTSIPREPGENPVPSLLREMQAPLPGIYLILLQCLFWIREKAWEWEEDEDTDGVLEGTLKCFFAVLDRRLFDYGLVQHPCDVECVLMILIHGLGVSSLPCAARVGKCLLHYKPTLTPSQQKFPSWDLIFKVMDITAGYRSLSKEERKAVLNQMQDLFVHPGSVVFVEGDEIEGEVVLDPSHCRVRPDLYILKEQMELDLGL